MYFLGSFILICVIAIAYHDTSTVFHPIETRSKTVFHYSPTFELLNLSCESSKKPSKHKNTRNLLSEHTAEYLSGRSNFQRYLNYFSTTPSFLKRSLIEELMSQSELNQHLSDKLPSYQHTRETKTYRKLYAFESEETLINDDTAGGQINPFVIALNEEQLVIIWLDTNSKERLGMQQVDASLNRLGSQILLSDDSIVIKPDARPSASPLSNGNYVIAWEGADMNIYAMIFDDSNTAISSLIQINDPETDFNQDISIATLTDGSFVVTWSGRDEYDEILAHHFTDSGSSISGIIDVYVANAKPTGEPRIAALKDEGFVITWITDTEDAEFDVLYQVFDNDGNPIGDSPSIANTDTANSQETVRIACLTDGKFVITYSSIKQDTSEHSSEHGQEDYDQGGVYAQLFDASGNKIGIEFLVNTYTTGIQRPEDIVPLYDGSFLITWGSQEQDGSAFGVYAQRYDANATPIGNEFLINDYKDDNQSFSNMAATVDGFVVAWQSEKQDGFKNGIYAKAYRDEIISITVTYPLADATVYKYQTFSYVIPANTFTVTSNSEGSLTYSATLKLGEDELDMSASWVWLSFDSSTRTFTGYPDQEGSYVVEVTATQGSATGIDDFIIDVVSNAKPILNSQIPVQLIPFNSEIIWEYYIPVYTFSDAEGDPITYTDAFMVLNGEERSLNVVWTSLSFNDGRLYGIPNLSGNYVVRIYADDGLGVLNPTAADIDIEVFSQGLEILELSNLNQAGSKGLIMRNGDHFWVANDNILKQFNLNSNDPMFIQDSETEYVFLDNVSSIGEISETEIIAGDQSGNIKLLSSYNYEERMHLTVNESISDIIIHDEYSFYVSHGHSISYVTISDENMQVDTTISIDSPIRKITEIDDMVYAATEHGIYQISISQMIYNRIDILDPVSIYDISSKDSYLLALDGISLIIIDANDPDNLWVTAEQALLSSGISFYVFQKEENTMCLIVEESSGISIVNVSNPEQIIYEGYFYTAEIVNQVLVDVTGHWGIILEQYTVYTIEIFRKDVLIERCDTSSTEDSCDDLKNVQAGRDFSKDLTINEQKPTYYQGYFYGYFYIFSATWYSDGSSSPLPNWVGSTQEETDSFTVSGTVPESLVSTVVHIEVIAHVYNANSELVITLKDLFSLSVVPRESSLAIEIPDQSLQVGDEWLFSFSEDTFNDANEYKCEYQINSEWINSYDISFILFIPEQRKWYISLSDSTKETLFQCDPCDSSVYSTTYVFKVTARNDESEYDPGVSTTFNLFLYSGRIPDQEIHPGISQTIILDEDIFPTEDTYTVWLLDEDGEAQILPWWMSFISNERKILMFPSASEVGQDFNIQVNGLNDENNFVSEFTIKVRNQDPVIIEELTSQKIKLGDLLDYTVPDIAFTDPDSDSLTYTSQWLKDDGSQTSALPSWMNFDSGTRTFYGIPLSEGTFTILVYANDGFGGETSQELILECYNNVPQRNHAIPLDNQSIHIGDSFTYTLNSNLFIDEDEDSLTFSAIQSDGSSLPLWLSFNTNSLTFSGTPSDTELLDNPVNIQITASDGYSSASELFSLNITNVAPVEIYPVSTQIYNEIDQRTLELKPGVRIEFVVSSTTFCDDDNDELSYSARLSDGDPLPEWLVFDSNTLMFYGTPTEVQTLNISMTAFDGYSSVVTYFTFDIQNKQPVVSVSLQSQFDSLYPDFLIDGSFLDFQFSSSTFQDEDDESLTYSVQFKEDGEWRSLDYVWLEFEGRTFSGTATSNSINNSTIIVQVTASDGFESVTDELYITVLSLFPETFQDLLYIESQRSSIEIEVSTNGPKLSVFSYGSVSVLDLSNGQKTDWKLEGSPSDVNYILERVDYRETSSRMLTESLVYLKINSIEQEYPISVFSLQQPIISYPIPNQQTYIENTFSINVKKYFDYIDQDLLTYSFSLTSKPGGSKDWLSFDSRTLSGIPTDSTDTGVYKIEITVEDEFGESSSESFSLEVNYTILQFMITYSLILLELGGPLLTLLGLFAFRKGIVNYFFKASKIYAPLEIDANELSIRKLFILRKDEEKIAKRIFKKLSKDYEIDEDSLIYDLDRVLSEKTSLQKDYKSVIYPEVYDASQYQSRCTSFKNCLENNYSSTIEINKKKYHAKYLYLCIKDLIYKKSLSPDQIRELETLVDRFKEHMLNSYLQKMSRTYDYISVGSWGKTKDAWTVQVPDLRELPISEYHELRNFLESHKSRIKTDIFLNKLRIEQWKDRALRLKELSDLDKIKIYYESGSCCKMKKKNVLKEWIYRKWLTVNLNDDELTIEFDDLERHQKEDIHVQMYDVDGYLVLETLLISSRRSIIQVPVKDNVSKSRIDFFAEDQIEIKEECL